MWLPFVISKNKTKQKKAKEKQETLPEAKCEFWTNIIDKENIKIAKYWLSHVVCVSLGAMTYLLLSPWLIDSFRNGFNVMEQSLNSVCTKWFVILIAFRSLLHQWIYLSGWWLVQLTEFISGLDWWYIFYKYVSDFPALLKAS